MAALSPSLAFTLEQFFGWFFRVRKRFREWTYFGDFIFIRINVNAKAKIVCFGIPNFFQVNKVKMFQAYFLQQLSSIAKVYYGYIPAYRRRLTFSSFYGCNGESFILDDGTKNRIASKKSNCVFVSFELLTYKQHIYTNMHTSDKR